MNKITKKTDQKACCSTFVTAASDGAVAGIMAERYIVTNKY